MTEPGQYTYNSRVVPTQGGKSVTHEPGVAYGANGRILYTYNWGIMASTDSGNTWTFLSPYT